jgi:dolichol-phosphate mannosyltransferase
VSRVLVTGGTGFVGANLARRLLGDGHDVHLLVRQSYAPWRIAEIRDSLTLHVVNLADASAVAESVRAIRPDWIFHLAAYGAYPRQTDLPTMVQTNVVGTINLVNAGVAAGCAAFVHAGSSSEYGFKDHPPPEQDALEPNSHYAWSKASATLYCRLTAQRENAPITTLRLYSAFGPYEEPSRLMPTLIARGFRGELPPLVDPHVARDFVYIDDVCEAFVLAATVPSTDVGAIYNVGSGIQTSISQLVDLARRELQIDHEPTWGSMANRSWDTSVWVSDNRAIQAALGWRPRYSLQAGFREFVVWMKERAPAMADGLE